MIRVISDLHLEFEENKNNLDEIISNKSKSKYTILAGDITNFNEKNENLPKLVEILKKNTDYIIYVLGNHEYYTCKNTKLFPNILSEYQDLCKTLGIILLNDSYFETEDFIFYGTTLWSKLSNIVYNEFGTRKNKSDSYINEFGTRKNKSDNYINNLHDKSAKLIDDFLVNNVSLKPIVMITHHLPSYSLIDPIYASYSSYNSAFASNLDHLIKYPIKYWIYGHTHSPSTKIINNVTCICNPHGYPGENKKYDEVII